MSTNTNGKAPAKKRKRITQEYIVERLPESVLPSFRTQLLRKAPAVLARLLMIIEDEKTSTSDKLKAIEIFLKYSIAPPVAETAAQPGTTAKLVDVLLQPNATAAPAPPPAPEGEPNVE